MSLGVLKSNLQRDQEATAAEEVSARTEETEALDVQKVEGEIEATIEEMAEDHEMVEIEEMIVHEEIDAQEKTLFEYS